ncbi:MAG: TRAP transporter large permease [Anaerobutyricum sp.]|nr:TRAP transporter large permease [Anaerobutyricum sp.]
MAMIAVFFVVFLIFAFLRIPVGFAILLGGIAGYAVGGLPFATWPASLFAGLDSFPLLAIPAFFLAGDLMASGGISEAIVDFINAIVKRIRGALGCVLVVTCALFGAITGSSVATVSAVGNILKDPMLKAGYDKKYFTALISAAGFLGTLIPPSVPGIMYALVANQKVTDVWMSTVGPGILLTVLYCVVNYFIFGRKMPKITEPFKFSTFTDDLAKATPKALVAFIMPAIIFGGVYGGAFTATEAGAVAVVYGILAGWLIYPVFFKMKPDHTLVHTVRKSAISSLTIALLICTATIIGRMVALGGVTKVITDFMMNITDSKVVFLLICNVLLILVGMFLETNTGILLFCPILCPIAQAYGIDLVHFGAMLLLNLEIGLITPPFAANLFVACKMTKLSIDEILKDLIPFFLVCIPILLITTFWEPFSLFIPNLLNG